MRQPPESFGVYLLAAGVIFAVVYVVAWIAPGGRNTHDPFATVMPIQLYTRSIGGMIRWPALIGLVLVVGLYAFEVWVCIGCST
jgi:hypothetical protein